MTTYAAGQIMCGGEGRVHVRIWGEMHYILAEDLGNLFFVGKWVPLMKKVKSLHEVPKAVGSVFINRSGRTVIIEFGNQRYMLPRDKFLAVALGEEVACIFFEAPGNEPEIETISPRKGGDAS
jgi:hypothetical protein